ncbi:MAG TPA: NAD(P)-dependent alcohol dehydrogenase [Herbaspirillum sp.]
METERDQQGIRIMNTTMKAWQLSAYGLNNLQLASLPIPVPGEGDVLVRVSAVSLNYRDKLAVEGGYFPDEPAFPFVPASDMAGEIVGAGAKVSRFRIGDRVSGNFRTRWIDRLAPYSLADHSLSLGGPLNGVLAEYIVLPEYAIVKAPSSLSDEEVSTLPIAALTPWYALIETGHLKAGQTVLVQGTGGVSLFGMQIAQAHGAKVIVTSRDDAKLERTKALGASGFINTRTTPAWAARALELTNGQGVDHILDVMGGDSLQQSLDAVAPEGRITCIGFLQGANVNFNVIPLLVKRAVIQGNSVAPRSAFEAMNRAFDEYGIKPVIEKVYPFSDVPSAFEHLARGAFGKVVISLLTN